MNDFSNASHALAYYAGHIMDHGEEVGSRAGRTMEITHSHFALKQPWQREILVPGRKPNVAAQIAETMWVLSGRNDIEWLGHYLPRAADFSDDGQVWRAGYGPRLRKWVAHPAHHLIDQFAECYRLLSEDPSTRRAVMSLWDPTVDYVASKDIPCNNWLSWSSRLGYLDLSVAIRSNDLIWGWSGVNQFEWSVLLEIMAGLLGLRVGKLVFTQTSFHIYDRHWEQARNISKSMVGTPNLKDSPRFKWASVPTVSGSTNPIGDLDGLVKHWFELEYDIRTGSPMVQGYVDKFPEPMLRSWLRVLQWWWGGGSRDRWMSDLDGTRLWVACDPAFSVQPKQPNPVATTPNQVRVDNGMAPLPSKFIETVVALHTEKDAAYGDSWKRRGEMLGIMANIARKIDRLGKGETQDETSTDTACDLLVYLAKYRIWLAEQNDDIMYRAWGGSDGPGGANEVLLDRDTSGPYLDQRASEDIETNLRLNFEDLEAAVLAAATGDPDQRERRVTIVNIMLGDAYILARRLWEAEQPTSNPYAGADVD